MVQMGKSKYSEEFKREALRICEQQGVRTASDKLGIPIKTMYLWQRAERLGRGMPLKGLKPGETAEEGIKRLEREIDELREANHILKKAMGFLVLGSKHTTIGKDGILQMNIIFRRWLNESFSSNR
jgi:transposase